MICVKTCFNHGSNTTLTSMAEKRLFPGRQEKQRWEQELKQKLEPRYYVSMLFANREGLWGARHTYHLYVFFAESESQSEKMQTTLAKHDGGIELSVNSDKFSCKIPYAEKLLLNIKVDDNKCYKTACIGRHDASITRQEILDKSFQKQWLLSFTLICNNQYTCVSETDIKISVTPLNDQDIPLSKPTDMTYHIKFNCEPTKKVVSVGTWGAEKPNQSIITRRAQKLYSMKLQIEKNVGDLTQIINLLVEHGIVKLEEAANISGNSHEPAVELFRHLIFQDQGIERCINVLERNKSENYKELAGILREVLNEF